MPQSFASLHHHFVFSTKNREPFITEELQPRLYAYIGGIVRDTKSCLVAAGGMPDHIHLLVDLSRELAVAVALRLIKSNSSGWIHKTFPEQRAFAWQNGYGAFAVSYSNADSVEAYIASQAEHHRKQTFKQEFIAFLKRHKIEYDERYIWD
jgi:REP element-mobilizing transposase RayT